MAWLTELVAAPLAGVLLRRIVPVLVGLALGALAAAELVPQEMADCVNGAAPIPFVSSSNSQAPQPAVSH